MARSYDQILTRGPKDNLASTPIIDGKLRITTDSHQLFMDFGVTRFEITDVVKGLTEAQIRLLGSPLDKIYFSSDTYKLMYFSTEWLILGGATPFAAITDPINVDITAAVGTSKDYARADHAHAIVVSEGDGDGQIKIAGQNVNVHGLGDLAYLSSIGSTAINSTSDDFDMDFGELTDPPVDDNPT